LIDRGLGEILLQEKILLALDLFVGTEFEKIFLYYLWGHNKKAQLPFLFSKIGRWWGNDPQNRTEAEIDLFATRQDAALFTNANGAMNRVGRLCSTFWNIEQQC